MRYPKFFLALLVLSGLVSVSCTDTSEVEERIDSLEQRVSELEDAAGAVNKNAWAISKLYRDGITIAGFDRTQTGYRLTLSDGTPVEITFGAGVD